MTVYVIGDIHGRYQAFHDVFTASGLRPGSDRLITLGDVVDYGPCTRQCVDLLLSVRDRISVLGNHDLWFLEWAFLERARPEWIFQGGAATIRSYGGSPGNVPESHRVFFKNSVPYYVDEQDRLYVHGGFDPERPLSGQDPYDLLWDRTLVEYSRERPVTGYRHVFIGHTRTQAAAGSDEPVVRHNVTLCDTGAGYGGYVSLIDADTGRYWQSGKADRL